MSSTCWPKFSSWYQVTGVPGIFEAATLKGEFSGTDGASSPQAITKTCLPLCTLATCFLLLGAKARNQVKRDVASVTATPIAILVSMDSPIDEIFEVRSSSMVDCE